MENLIFCTVIPEKGGQSLDFLSWTNCMGSYGFITSHSFLIPGLDILQHKTK